ncbi:MAG: HNH endonuclease [DPANN group archaeon]|nr:HNH endonuclease [DPANN group archaeon]
MPNYIGPKEPPQEWRDIRVEIYKEHKGMCHFCSKHVPEDSYTIHHKLMRQFAPESEQSLEGLLRRDGIHNRRNLVPAHPACHKKHHGKLVKLFGAR